MENTSWNKGVISDKRLPSDFQNGTTVIVKNNSVEVL